MRDLPALDGDVVEVDGRGLCAVPGLVDCHTHAAFGGDRVDEFSLRAGGASYEELHAAGGGILSTVRATRALGEDGLRAAVERHRDWMRASGTTTFEAKSGYGLDKDTELASLRAIRDAGGFPTWLGAHAVPPEFADADAYLDFALAEVLPRSGRDRRGGGRLPRARRVRRGPGAPLPRGVPRRRPRAAPPRRPVHGVGRDPARDRARARAPSTISRRRERTGSSALAASDVTGVLLPASALFLDRPMPPARALVDAGAAVALATDFNPGSAFTREPSARLLARVHAAPPVAGGGARRVHGERRARARPRRPDRPPRAGLPRRHHAPRCARLALPRVPPRRAGRLQGRRGRRASLNPMATRKQRKRMQKERRHEYENVWVDPDGNELEEPPEELRRAGDTRHDVDSRKPQRSASSSSSSAARPALRSRRRGGARRSARSSWAS